jgi:histidinol-phosphatase
MKSPYVPVAIDAVKAAEAIILTHYKSDLVVSTKADDTPVTIADQQSEEAIKRIIRTAFPGHTFFGEEGEKVDLQNHKATRGLSTRLTEQRVLYAASPCLVRCLR